MSDKEEKKKGRKRRGNGHEEPSQSDKNLQKDMRGGHKKDKLADIQANREYSKEFPEMVCDFNEEFDPTFHPTRVIEVMSEGASPEELCVELGVLPTVILRWFKLHQEFKDAVCEGAMLSMAWWKTQGRKNIHNPYFNNTLYINEMSARFHQSKKPKDISENLVDERFEASIEDMLDLDNMSKDDIKRELEEADGKRTVKKRKTSK